MRPSKILEVKDNLSKEEKEKIEVDLGKIRRTWFSVAENSYRQIVAI